MTDAPAPVLAVAGYALDYLTPAGRRRALDAIDLTIAPGEVVGLVGESGSGKSSLALAIMRALAPNARDAGGSIALSELPLIGLPEVEMAAIRGRRIGMVFQDPAASLNPTMTLGAQIIEVLTRHRGLDRAPARDEAERLLARVGIADPAAMLRRYPHEASGGEKQRVVIATAFSCRPELMLFDEPTTALDVITARQILDLLAELQAETGVASLYISHDLAVVSRVASRVAVMHRGRVVDTGPIARVFAAPRDDYTRQLIAAVPDPRQRLVADEPAPADPLLKVRDLSVTYARPTLLGGLLGRRPTPAARDLSLEIAPGEIVGVVGESGSGKSTLARALTGLARFEGELTVAGRRVTGAADMDAAYRRQVQIVFQHPDSSLNPRQTVRAILERPLVLAGEPAAARAGRIGELLDAVRLPRDHAARHPHQLSGGEKQRVAIARAFASRPRLVICDEITAALDVSVQATITRLLLDLRRETGAAFLFISHDINLVRQIAHRLVVMRRGRIVETLTPGALAAGAATDDYTRALIDAVPTLAA